MERYHIYKLGIAILFYAIYCRRPLIASALSTHQTTDGEEYVYYQGVQGKPGVDFPVHARIPRTSFSCKTVESGYYADLDTDCQVFHICNGGAKISFLCPNGTIFQQSELICEWWFKVNCTDSPNYYSESAELLRGEWWKRKNLRGSTQNRNAPPTTRRKPKQEFNNNEQPAQNQIGNGLRKKSVQANDEENVNRVSDTRREKGKSVDSSFARNTNTEARVQSRRKQVNGERGGRKFNQNYHNNQNVKDEETENDAAISEESQVPEETASYYKNNRNVIESSDKPATSRYPNHKEIYSEIQDVKFYSTKTTSRFTQTLPPQTYSTNRIPLNDGKPFVISTPKSTYNIHRNGYSSNRNDYNRVTTETFRYSPTVPPFTARKKPQVTTIIPQIIVDGQVGSESSDSRQYEDSSSTFVPPFESQRDGQITEVPVSNSEAPDGNVYTTPNSIRNDLNRQGISFTERINPFSGLDDVIHTQTAATHNKAQEATNFGSDIERRPVNNEFKDSTRNTYYSSSPRTKQHNPSANKYDTNTKDSHYSYEIATDSSSNSKSKPLAHEQDGTTRDSYGLSVVRASTRDNYYPSSPSATGNKHDVYFEGDKQNNPSANKYDTTTKDSHYSYEIGTDSSGNSKSKPVAHGHDATTRDSYEPSVVRASTIDNYYQSSPSATGDKHDVYFEGDKQNNPSGNKYDTTTKDNRYSYEIETDSSSGSKTKTVAHANYATTLNSYDPSVLKTSTRDNYYTSSRSATDNKHGVDREGDRQNNPSGNKYDSATKDSYYSYEIGTGPSSDGKSKLVSDGHDATTRDSYYPSVVRSATAKYGSELGSNTKSKLQSNIYETTTRSIYSSDSVDERKNQNNFNDNARQSQNNIPNSHQVKLNIALSPHSVDSSTVGTFDYSTLQSRKYSDQSTITNSNIFSSKTNIPNSTSEGQENTPSSSGNASINDGTSFENKNKEKGILEVVQHNSRVSENNKSKVDANTEQPASQSSYGDACGDDIVYPEIKKDQIVVGKNKIVIDDTSIPTTEQNIVRIIGSNAQETQPIRPSDYGRSSLKPVTNSAIFRLNVKDSFNTEKPNDLLVTKQSGDTGAQLSYISTTFTSSNTYLPKQTTFRTFTESYDKNTQQTKSHTYLPKGSTPAPFSANNRFLNNKALLNEDISFPQLVRTRDNNLKTSAGVPQISEEIRKEFALKPKPFELPPRRTDDFGANSKIANGKIGASSPDYQVSSARPFSAGPHDYEANTIVPTLPTPFPRDGTKVSEHLSNMLTTLREIVNARANNNLTTDSSRPGLIIPPSVGPQTLHTLAVYFANALDNISSENVSDELPNSDEAQAINELLTHSTLNRYRELFKDEPEEAAAGTTSEPEELAEESNDLEGQHSKAAVTPRVRQLAQVFTKALSSYLDDPDMFKKVLQEARPTEPSLSIFKGVRGDTNDDDELLNYSDADIKPNLPRLSTTTPSPRPTWAYILAPNNSNSYEYNSINGDGEHLQSADSQSFATQFNNYVKEKHFGKGIKNIQSTTPISVGIKENLPVDHWTASANATKLWKDKLYTNPASINENLNIDLRPPDSQEGAGALSETADVNYSLSNLPKDDLNSTQVHKILVDIVNSTTDNGNKLKRILNKLNTTQEDFLAKMREVEQNPLTRRLILLLISECASNITKIESKINSNTATSNSGISDKTSELFESSRRAEQDKFSKHNSPIPIYVDSSLKDDDEDTRALQLLNSLYTIASKYGK